MDGNLLQLLSDDQSIKFYVELNRFVDWYALALSRHLSDKAQPISLHPYRVLTDETRTTLLSLGENEEYPTLLRQKVRENFTLLLRGKSLLALLVRNVGYGKLQVRHSQQSILQLVAIRPGPLLARMSAEVERVMRGASTPME